MSNLGGQIEPGAEELLKEHPMEAAQHSAWNFCGYVWWDPDWELFIEEVWVYKAPQERFAAETLSDLQEEVNYKYGWQ